MKSLSFYILFILVVSSCDPTPPCNLDYLNNKSYIGSVNYCSGMPANHLHFPARTHLIVDDSHIQLSIVSLDSNISWNFNDSAYFKCWYAEGNEKYKLYSINSDLESGDIGRFGHNMFYNFQKDSCTTSYFTGGLE